MRSMLRLGLELMVVKGTGDEMVLVVVVKVEFKDERVVCSLSMRLRSFESSA